MLVLATVAAGCGDGDGDGFPFGAAGSGQSASGTPGTGSGPSAGSGSSGSGADGGSSESGAGGTTRGVDDTGLTGGATSNAGSTGMITAGSDTAATDDAGGDEATTVGAGGFICEMGNTWQTLGCGGSYRDDFLGAFGDVQDVCGESFLFQDQIFVFDALVSESVTVQYTAMPDQPDMAIFVLEGICDTGACIGKSTDDDGDRHNFTFDVTAGTTYYIDLEAPSAQPQYTIWLSCDG